MNLSIAAASATQAVVVDRLRQIPLEFWWKMALGLGAIVAVGMILRKVAKMNRLLLGVGLLLGLTTIGLNWVYERNEPKWATPVVQVIAGFLPTKARG